MKKLIFHLISFTAIVILSISCNEDILDLTPTDSVTDDAVFNGTDAGLMYAFVNNISQGLPDGYEWAMLASVTDEAHMNGGSWAGMTLIMLSQLTESNLSAFNSGSYYGFYNWESVYQKIRAANLFFSKIGASPVDDATKDELKGEVYFLRAYLYHNLVAMYGGVPIITKAYTLSDDFNIPRDSYADCIEYISSQCDSAAMLLPLTQAEMGRATQGAALALKSRTLLYAASDLYNTPSIWASYSNPELVGYTSASSSDRQARWQKAKDAAKAVIDLDQYSLYQPEPADQAEAAENCYQLFLSMSTPEDIFSRYYSTEHSGTWTTHRPHTFNNPCGYHGWGCNVPTQQMVDSYEMSDGTPFSWDDPIAAAAPYENRDPRFYATVLYDGALWRERPSDVSGGPNIQTGHYYSDASTILDGLDTRGTNGGIDTWNGTFTGYYHKKCIDNSLDAGYGNTQQTIPWRFLRYGEVLLNYAEACIGLGEEAEAITYINMIRTRAGMPDITTSGADLVNSLRNERKIELAFEELRYYDIRRWMIGEEAYADVEAINILYGSPSSFSPTYGTGTPTYTVETVDDREWNAKNYFLPISQDEMYKNNNLIQNPGY